MYLMLVFFESFFALSIGFCAVFDADEDDDDDVCACLVVLVLVLSVAAFFIAVCCCAIVFVVDLIPLGVVFVAAFAVAVATEKRRNKENIFYSGSRDGGYCEGRVVEGVVKWCRALKK